MNRHLFAALLVTIAGCHDDETATSAQLATAELGSAMPDAGTIDEAPDAGSGSDAGTYDVCDELAAGRISADELSAQTLDTCNGVAPAVPSCQLTPIAAYNAGEPGCHVWDPGAGDLGNFRFACPTDIYEQQELCRFALATLEPPPAQIDPVPWTEYEDTSMYPPPSYADSMNDYENPSPGNAKRNVVVIGSSLLSLHNQVNNGPHCGVGNPGRPQTTADDRGIIGSDFTASPAWHTRVPWLRVFRGARSGHESGHVLNAGANTPDACRQAWGMNVSPAQAGVNWFAGKDNRLMITDGGLINDLKNVNGESWSRTLSDVVTCNALERAVPLINGILDAEHLVLNWGWPGWLEKRRWVWRQPPVIRLQRTSPIGGWAQALDAPANMRRPRCAYVVHLAGNGRIPKLTLAAITAVHKEVRPLVRLWRNGPPGSPAPGNLAAIKAAYVGVSKQVWLQYPYMDAAQVTVRGADLALLFQPGGAAAKLVQAWGQNAVLTINAIDIGLAGRFRQITDDLNEVMYNAIGCNAVAPFAPGHPARVCARDAAMRPIVIITQDNFANWGAIDHQNTILGGMPHPSAAGANKLGAAINAADMLP